MSRVVAWVPDLLFGSNVLGSLRAAGHEAVLAGSAEALEREVPGSDVVIVDLCADVAERLRALATIDLAGARTLAFYSHVEAETRRAAEQAGIDRVVPRSRMARDGAALVAGLTP